MHTSAGRGVLESDDLAPGQFRRRLDEVRARIRTKRCGRRTEESYTDWIERFIFFHGRRHPGTWARRGSRLFVRAGDGATTRNPVLAALLFLYRARLALAVSTRETRRGT